MDITDPFDVKQKLGAEGRLFLLGAYLRDLVIILVATLHARAILVQMP